MSRRRSSPTSGHYVAAFSMHPPDAPAFVALAVHANGARDPEVVPLSVGDAHQLGTTLMDLVGALLAGVPRPWDDDPGRTPFGSRGRRGGQPKAAPRRVGPDPRRPETPIRPAPRPGSGA